MIHNSPKLALALVLGLACPAWSFAQEAAMVPKSVPLTPTQQAEKEAKAKERDRKRQVKAKQDAELKARAVDINHATKAELMKGLNISDKFAAAIIGKRPYKSKAELVSKHAIPESTYKDIHSLVVVK